LEGARRSRREGDRDSQCEKQDRGSRVGVGGGRKLGKKQMPRRGEDGREGRREERETRRREKTAGKGGKEEEEKVRGEERRGRGRVNLTHTTRPQITVVQESLHSVAETTVQSTNVFTYELNSDIDILKEVRRMSEGEINPISLLLD
jgi:hypothetical protein